MTGVTEISLELIDTADGFLSLEDEWDVLAVRGVDTVFLTHFWLSAWLREHGEGTLPRVLTLRRDGLLVAALPLAETRGAAIRRWAFMGAGVLTPNHLDVVAAPEEREEALGTFATALLERAGDWDVLDLDKLPADVTSPATLRAAFEKAGLATSLVTSAVCRYAELPASFDEYFASLSRSTRSNVRRRSRHLEDQHPDRRFGRVESEDELAEALEALFRLHDARWTAKGYPGAFHDPRAARFHTSVASAALRRGALRLYTLSVGGSVAAVKYGFKVGGAVQEYQSCIDEALSEFSPGQLLMAKAVERTIEERAARYDLLEGEEAYKDEWCAGRRENVRLRVFNRTLGGRLAHLQERSARSVVSAARRWVPADLRESGLKALSWRRLRSR